MKASKFFRNFYGIAEENQQENQEDPKKPKKKFSWAEFYERNKFALWLFLAIVGSIVTTIFLGLSIGSIHVMVAFLVVYLMLSGVIKTNGTSYPKFLFWIWLLLTWIIYCAFGLLFIDRQDLLPSHRTGLILGIIAAVIFFFFLPPISYWLKLNTSYSDEEEVSNEEKKLMPTKTDKKLHLWLMLLVTVWLSISTVCISLIENRRLTDKRQEVQLEQMAFKDITNKTFIVEDDNWFGDDVYAIIQTSDEIVAVKVVYYPEVCDASKVKVLVNGTVIINGREYQDFSKISFETPAPK